MEENLPARDHGAGNPNTLAGHDYEYDEAQDARWLGRRVALLRHIVSFRHRR